MSFIVTLLTSISVYRLFLSPIRNFPGPTLAALSKFWYIYHSAGGGMPKVVSKLHDKYGDVVRIGPNELSICSLDAVEVILGSKGKLSKGPWYDAMWADKVGRSVHALKDIDAHAQRRRYWDKAMTGPAVKNYLVFLEECVDHLCRRLREDYKKASVQNLSRIMDHLVFDVIGEVTCARSFGMIENGEDHTYIHFMEKGFRAICVLAEIPWVLPILTLLPVVKEQAAIEAFLNNAMMDRYKRGSTRPDFFSYLIQENGQLQPGMTMKDLDADIRVAIMAGAGTSATILTFIFEFLSQHPEWARRLREEVDARYRGDGDFDLDDTPVLDAIMNETLRVRPTVPARSQRVVPTGGIFISGHYIPGGTLVGIPPPVIMRDPRNFSPHPTTWRPERWLHPEKEQTFRRSAFIPFSYGPFNCSGKALGLLVVRYSLARLVHEFDVSAASEHDGEMFERSIREYLSVQKGPFWAVVRPRG
ncbi:cytochrome P450 [Stereum hirsutum FP-91666 SS1]|uniref:cytochrome P450 n=1 Tax=Stereum hirsutum (strain FP-91666) TaxID=721885 RepID=UPI00044492F3|nr:cytochrome P450 [Stereum hirsutum FP-91666 SS1]EIM81015.1 cytochrome P450 [Stereum hirsutum FP-91666 SS1]